jgi:hypothetical protein
MSSKNFLRFGVLFAALFVFGTASAYAQGTCTNCTTVNSTLTLSATAETAIQLDVATNGGATVSGSAGAFTVSFGNVNGLGLGTPATGVTLGTVDSTGAIYTTPVSVTPTFSGFTSTTATVKVYQDSTTSAASQSAAREGSAAGSVATVPTTAGAATTVSSTAATATAITRYVGLFVSNANGSSKVVGALAPKFIYVVTVP